MSNILGNMPPVFGSGYRGVVPAPTAADVSAQNILRADGTWGAQATSGPLPSQTGNAAKLLTTDGTNASWASSLNTFQFGDVTLGSAGPSVKSTLSARAPRQGLVFDGTTGVSVSTPALGTADFSISFFVRRDSSAVQQYLVGNDNVGCLYVGFRTTGALYSGKTAGSANSDLNIGNVVGKWQHIVLVRSGGNITGYADGVSVGSVTDVGSNYTTGAYSLFQASAGAAALVGAAMSPYFYNRALSASEVVALYEAGAPAGADYNSASNTALNTVAPTVVGGGTLSATSATGFTFTGSSASGFVLIPGQSTPALSYVGTRYRVTFTASITTGTVTFSGRGVSALQNTTAVSAGSNSFIITFNQAMTTNSSAGFEFDSSGTATYSISNLSITPLGLLLAPDAAQAGGGLTWYDTSGNAANITLPASGVSWNVPSSRVLGGNWTNTGNLTLSTSGSSINTGTSNASDSAYISLSGGGAAGNSRGSSVYVTGNEFTTGNAKGSLQLEAGYDATMSNILDGSVLFGTGGTAVVGYFNRIGNLILGPAAADSGNGKLQLATHSTSAGGIGFGTDVSLYRNGSGGLLATTAGTLTGGVGVGYFSITTSGASPLVLGTNGVEGFRIDGSNQNATFAGNAKINSSAATTRALSVTNSLGNVDIGVFGANGVGYFGTTTATDVQIYAHNAFVLGFDSAKAATFTGTIATQNGTASTPASASATGTAGTIKWDASYIYVCTATNTWKRVAIATW